MENHRESHKVGYEMRDIILGWQDGLVNVLGIVLALAAAAYVNPEITTAAIIIGGLAATFAESISMAAVGYTSTKAYESYYKSELEREKREIEEIPDAERKEIRDIYIQKGFSGTLLNKIVQKITSNKKIWLDTMMREELHLTPPEKNSALKSAAIIGFAAIIGSLVPLTPFLFFPVFDGMIGSILFSLLVLFLLGVAKAKVTTGSWFKSGLEIAVIGILAALVGFVIGYGAGTVV